MSFLDILAQALTGIHPDAASNQPAPDPTIPVTNSPAVSTPAPAPSDANQIVVTANRNTPQASRSPNYPAAPDISGQTNGPDAPDFGNRNWAEAAKQAVLNDRGKPKSHLHQTLDNIGDALLLASGLPQIHKQHQDEEDLQNAVAGFTAHPDLASERAASVDPKAGEDIWDKYQANNYRQAQLASLEASRQSNADKDHYSVVKDTRITASRALQAAGDDPAKQAAAMGLIQRYAASNGVAMNELGLSPNMSSQDIAVYRNTDMSGYQQNELPIRQQQADASTATANAKTVMANKYEPPNHPARAPTDQETFFTIGNIPPEQRTQAQQDFYKKYTQGTHHGILDSLGVPPPSNVPDRQKGWKVKRN